MKSTSEDLYHINELVRLILNDSKKLNKFKFENLELEYSNLQKRKLKIFDYYISIQTVLKDLEKTFVFLEIEYDSILKVFPTLENYKSYYIYFLENYLIRINSISDICGKIGNLICDSNIDDEKCNGYNFKDAIKLNHPTIASCLTDILVFTKESKEKRHKKLHKGTVEIDIMANVIHWSDFTRYTNIVFDEILYQKTKENIASEIENLQSEVEELVELLIKYYNELAKKYIEEI